MEKHGKFNRLEQLRHYVQDAFGEYGYCISKGKETKRGRINILIGGLENEKREN